MLAGVAEDHGLDVDRRSPFGGDVILAAINDGAVVHPGTENSADGAFELVPGIGGEFLAGAFLDQILEALHQLWRPLSSILVSSTCLLAGEKLGFEGLNDRLQTARGLRRASFARP